MADNIYATIDLGGTKIAGALAAADGTILIEKTVPTHSNEGPRAVIDRMAALVHDLAAESGHHPVALGAGIPGLADIQNGVVKFLPNLPTNWRDVPLRDWLAPQINCDVYLLNDARLATLGELTYGRGRTANTMVFFTLGTGIGGGVAVDGKLRLGPLGAAGEIGHQIILPDGPVCGCGNRGCLETLASGPAIAAKGAWLVNSGRAPKLHDIVGGDTGRITPREMVQAAEAGDTAVHEELVRAAEYIGIGAVNIVVILHPDLIVLGGSVAGMGDILFDTVRQTIQRRVGMFPPDNVRVEPSELGNRAGLLGGIALAVQGGFEN